MSFSIFHNLVINTSPEDVFHAVSQPKHLDNWWTLKSSGKPEQGTEYNLNFTDQYNWFCKVSKVAPNKSFHLKMTISDEDWNPTTFGFDLEEETGSTLVKFSHINWREANHEFKHSSFCWAILLKGLKDYLEKGTVIPFEDRS
ncbi:SRPBCC domain-containing protein [Tamlana sp. 2201CG12-4]|uniref:SRPBCC family protein n=1 Tax=Tamlana sp. 2201CG12-4 TaxID=3112582 RepID=UPI002DB7406F|nr:SRPBCC domain-containing protein [Tamlana sp. 2201CG12-4]MEC3907317.1 SRPBCC domain-containing protein [Tamlana sp. 2201CG12-4]